MGSDKTKDVRKKRFAHSVSGLWCEKQNGKFKDLVNILNNNLLFITDR